MVTLLKSIDGGVCDNDDDGVLGTCSLSLTRKYLLHRSKSFTVQLMPLIRTPCTIPFTTGSKNSVNFPQKYHSTSLFKSSRLRFMTNAENIPLNFLNAISWMSDRRTAFVKKYSRQTSVSASSLSTFTFSAFSSIAHSATTANP